MANAIGGSVVWNLDADPTKFNQGLDTASKKAKDFTSNVNKIDFTSMAGKASQSFGRIADSIGGVLKGLALMSVASGFGFGAMTKAAFDQVKQVENASFALKAYEKSGKKVNKVLNELVDYARSDLGVLFQRQDLFDAASTLKIYGVETKNLTRYTKIMSKGVAIGKTTFQELSEVLGRVAAEGILTSDSFDVLVRRGIKLPQSMRNAKVSADELFKALDKSLPDKILEGRANTIEGRMIRLQSAFRDLGGAILGVDKETSSFIKGGLGDQFVKTLENLRTQLRDPAMVKAFQDMGKAVGEFTSNALPMLFKGFKWLIENYDTVVAAVVAIGAAFVTAKIGEAISGIVEAATSLNKLGAASEGLTGLAKIAASGGWITLIVAAVVAVVGALVFLQIKFGIFTKAWKAIKSVAENVTKWYKTNVLPIFKMIGSGLVSIWNTVKNGLTTAWNSMKVATNTLIEFFKSVGKKISEQFSFKLIVGSFKLAYTIIKSVITNGIIPIFRVLSDASKLAFNVIKDAINVAVNSIKEVWKALDPVKKIFTDLKNQITILFNTIKSIVLSAWATIKPVWDQFYRVAIVPLIVGFQQLIVWAKKLWAMIQGPILTVLKIVGGIILVAFVAPLLILVTVIGAVLIIGALFIALIAKVISWIIQISTAVIKFFISAFVKMHEILTRVSLAIVSFVAKVVSAIVKFATTVGTYAQKAVNYFIALPGKIVGALGKTGSLLYNAGKAIIEGFKDGIVNAFEGVKKFVGGIASWIKDHKGPLEYDKKLLIPQGKAIMSGFNKGLTAGWSDTQGIISGIAPTISGPGDLSPSVMSPSVGGESSFGSTYITNEIGSITLANDVDADRFIQKLTMQDDIISRGLTPQRY